MILRLAPELQVNVMKRRGEGSKEVEFRALLVLGVRVGWELDGHGCPSYGVLQPRFAMISRVALSRRLRLGVKL
jgi:hypothetical protein